MEDYQRRQKEEIGKENQMKTEGGSEKIYGTEKTTGYVMLHGERWRKSIK
mgnify:CR=1 FL=1